MLYHDKGNRWAISSGMDSVVDLVIAKWPQITTKRLEQLLQMEKAQWSEMTKIHEMQMNLFKWALQYIIYKVNVLSLSA